MNENWGTIFWQLIIAQFWSSKESDDSLIYYSKYMAPLNYWTTFSPEILTYEVCLFPNPESHLNLITYVDDIKLPFPTHVRSPIT